IVDNIWRHTGPYSIPVLVVVGHVGLLGRLDELLWRQQRDLCRHNVLRDQVQWAPTRASALTLNSPTCEKPQPRLWGQEKSGNAQSAQGKAGFLAFEMAR